MFKTDFVLATLFSTLLALGATWFKLKGKKDTRKPDTCTSVLDLIGNTPLMLIQSLSNETKCKIYGKCEFFNPGGSVKDRVALQIIQDAMNQGALLQNGLVTEGTAGSTGVSLALVCQAYGLRCFIAMPDDAAIQKLQIMSALGAEVLRVKPVSISNPDHFVNIARRKAKEDMKGFFANQFENESNLKAHVKTGDEIWNQCKGKIDAFICGSGTGGTIAGVSKYLKSKNKKIQIWLSDITGSSLYNKIKRAGAHQHVAQYLLYRDANGGPTLYNGQETIANQWGGVTYTKVEAEGKRLRNPIDTIVEGVGLNRTTYNFSKAQVDNAIMNNDREAVEMAQYLLRNDGLFIGSSSAVNCLGAAKLAKILGPGHTIVTILCDGGERHISKFQNSEFLAHSNLTPTSTGTKLDFL